MIESPTSEANDDRNSRDDKAAIGKGTQTEIRRLSNEIMKMIEPPPPVELHPVYDIANLVIAIQNASQGFHQRWRAILTAEHWTRIKALTRRLGVMNKDEYDQLRPLADLIQELQNNIHTFISRPLRWEPQVKDEDRMDEKTQVTDLIRQGASTRLDDLAKQRLVDQKIPGWSDAFYRRGIGSTLVRARDIKSIYDAAAPVPVELPDDEATKFLFDVRIAVAEAIKEQKGIVKGWEP